MRQPPLFKSVEELHPDLAGLTDEDQLEQLIGMGDGDGVSMETMTNEDH